MKKYVFLALLVLGIVSSWWLQDYDFTGDAPVKDYKSVVYEIDGKRFRIDDSESESKIVTKYFGNEAVGDINGDGLDDVVFLLTQDGGGSGTFFYAVAAIKNGEGYIGSNAIFLGDRISPQTTDIYNGVINVNYAIRGENEPMTAKPSFGVTKYAVFSDGRISEIILESGEQILPGEIVMGHEVRSFKACSAKFEYWIMGNSPAYKEIMDSYAKLLPVGSTPYTPIFGFLIGKIVDSPTDGFGADYDNAFFAREIISASADGKCR